MTKQQYDIITILRKLGPLSQYGVIHAMRAKQHRYSPSGIRSRMAELERHGYIYKTGNTELTPTGRKAALYRVS